MQHHVVESLFTELRSLIQNLGQDGGLIGPSIYDTAQVIRLAPPASGVQQTLDWLVSQQQPDGGWGDPAFPRARDVPTLAALLALTLFAVSAHDRKVIRSGLEFLWQHAPIWAGPLPDALPIAIELLLPRLLEDAAAAGLNVPRVPYAGLIALGERRRCILAELPAHAGTPPAHVWEGWGIEPDPKLLDASGGVGHSPAATAAWLRASSGRADLAEARAKAHRYLAQASAATGTGIPGVVPTVWPITRYEQAFGLYALLSAGMLDHPALADLVQSQIADLAQAFRSTGIGFSDCFMSDGDDTAAAMAVLKASGHSVDLAALERFAHHDHFCAYSGELQPSLSVTAHAVHTLMLFDPASVRAQRYLIERQLPDGRWLDDKWNGSWVYTTAQAVIALADTAHIDVLQRALDALLTHQHTDGGWGTANDSIHEETAYGIFALRTLLSPGVADHAIYTALERAERWMFDSYRPDQQRRYPIWLGKENYQPDRIVRLIELAASIPSVHLPERLELTQSTEDTHTRQYGGRDLSTTDFSVID
jgi:hypothetical protein